MTQQPKKYDMLKMPGYPGGGKAFQEFITKNIRYPKEAEEANIVAMLPAVVVPAEDSASSCFLVFSKITLIVDLRVPFRPSNRASLVSLQRPSNNTFDILYSPKLCRF